MEFSDFGIVTLCDTNYFPGLLMLHRSVQESLPCPMACYDAGLSTADRERAAAIHNLEILRLPHDPSIERIQVSMSLVPPLAKANKRIWPLWICPILIRHAPFRRTIWMDCDLIVLRELAELLEAVRKAPVFTPENKAPHLTANRPELYELLPIHRQFNPLLPTVNAGVSGWDLERDAAVLDAYLYPVKMAAEDERVRKAISWHDQGALIWAIQSCGLERCVAPTTNWNRCVDNTSVAEQPIAWDDEFLSNARAQVPDVRILHWNGRQPPWIR